MDNEDDRQRPGRESLLTLVLTFLFGGGLLLFLIFVSGGFFLYVVLSVLAIGAMGYLHYLLWGQSLTREVAGEREELEFRERLQSDHEDPDPHREHIQRRR